MYKHQKRTEYINKGDSIQIKTDSYYEKLAQSVIEIEKKVPTTVMTLKKDIELAMSHIEDGSPKVVLTIEMKKDGPHLTKRWIEVKEQFNRK